MSKKSVLCIAFSFLCSYSIACTNFLAGRKATVDGSTLISYNADSYYLFGALYHYPAADYPADAMLDIHEWDTGKYLGQIKQAKHTFSVTGNINEYQVSIGETTFGGRHELVDSAGIMDYGSLMYIALQRSRTAREAIKVMTGLVAEYGYYSEGETFSIADPNEVWIMEMTGKGAHNKGALWVALRLPDDCVSGHANQARITSFPLNDSENCLYSDDVIAFAREKGWFKGKNTDFSFSDTYAPLDYSGLRICEARVWSVFRKLDPAMEKYISYVKGETRERMPLWIKPKQKVSARDFKKFMRDMYEETEFDMTKGALAGPFGTKLRHGPLAFKVDSTEYWHERPIATQQTGFTFVAQMRSWLPAYTGGILWFGVDDAASCIYVPIYCCTQKVPLCYDEKNGSLLEYSPTSAFWIYNAVANFAYGKYSFMMPEILKVQSKWENDFDRLIPAIDSAALSLDEKTAREFLTGFSNAQAENSTAAWKKLGEYLLVKYLDGNVKKETSKGVFDQNEYHIPASIIRAEYPAEYLKKILPDLQNMKGKTLTEINNRK
jgi:dipeptidase